MESIDSLKSELIARVNRYRCGSPEDGRRPLRGLASKAGVSLTWLSAFVNGKMPNPTLDTLNRVHTALQEFEGKQQ